MSIAEAHAILTAPGARFETEERVIRGVATRVFKNAPPTLRHIFETGRRFGPERTFIVYEDERVSYEAFARATLAIAADLAARGVKPGDRIAVVMRNLPEWVACFHAAALLGGVATPLNAWWSGPELEYGLVDSGARFAMIDHERYMRLADHFAACPALEHVYVCRAPGPLEAHGASRLEALVGPVGDWNTLGDRPLPNIALSPDDDAAICYTSGTTGRPKGAVLTHRNITTNVMSGALNQARRYLRRGEEPPVPDPANQRTTLLVVPLFHVTGLCSNLGPLMNTGGKLVLMHRWDAGKALGLIERERVNQTGGVPTIAWQLIEHPDRPNYDLTSLDTLSYGGAPSAPELVRLISQVFPNAVPGNAWGMTETSATFTGHLGEDYEHRPASCGVAGPTGDVKVVDAEGRALEPGRHGRDLQRRVGQDRRSWLDRRRRLCHHQRPGQRHADPRRRKHLLHRGGEYPLCAPRGDGRRPDRSAAQDPRRGAGRRGRAFAGFLGQRRGASRLRAREAGGLQGSCRRSLLARDAAAQSQWQDPEDRPQEAPPA